MKINVLKLKAVLEIAPKRDLLRPYLVGVHLNSKINALESTDGGCAIRIFDALQYEDNEEPLNQNLIIAYDDVLLAIRFAKKREFIELVCCDDGKVLLGNIIAQPMTDASYPDLDRFLVKKEAQTVKNHKTLGFDFNLLKKWEKAQKARKLQRNSIWKPDFYANEGPLMQTLADMQFVIMPYRLD